MNDLKKLKPCPYCGNTGPMFYKQNNGMFYVHCGRYWCDSKFTFCASIKDECIKKWNENADLINRGRRMNIGKAAGIFKNIDNAAATDAEKIEAINEVVAMETHNSITKVDVLRALNWAMRYCFFLECQNNSLKKIRDFYEKNDAVTDPDKCPFEHKPDCTYYPDGCGKCAYINP